MRDAKLLRERSDRSKLIPLGPTHGTSNSRPPWRVCAIERNEIDLGLFHKNLVLFHKI
jgi:hypothetical protein